MLVAIEDIVDEPIDDRRLSDSLIPQEDDLVFEQRRYGSLREI
jgi:hypothetical protein